MHVSNGGIAGRARQLRRRFLWRRSGRAGKLKHSPPAFAATIAMCSRQHQPSSLGCGASKLADAWYWCENIPVSTIYAACLQTRACRAGPAGSTSHRHIAWVAADRLTPFGWLSPLPTLSERPPTNQAVTRFLPASAGEPATDRHAFRNLWKPGRMPMHVFGRRQRDWQPSTDGMCRRFETFSNTRSHRLYSADNSTETACNCNFMIMFHMSSIELEMREDYL